MRDRSQASKRRHRPPPAPEDTLIQQKVVRDFRPDEIDLDDLAEAIRLLLGREGLGPSNSRRSPESELLFLPPQVTHVVERNELP